MIKLKLLLKEIQRGTWKAPKETPAQVVDVLHKIVAEVLRQQKNTNDYIKLYHPTLSEWIIQNPKNRYILLAYNMNESKWWAVGWPSTSAHKEVGIIDARQLNHIIETWV